MRALVLYSVLLGGFIASQAAAVVIHEDFNTAHDFLTAGTAGTIWDGFIGQGPRQAVDILNANMNKAGQLFIQSTNGRWQDPYPPSGTSDLGPLLYKTVSGDFTAIVEVTDYQSGVSYNAGGLMARVADDADAGAGEDWVAVTYFPMYNVNNKMDSTDNDARTEIGPWPASVHRYLMLERVDDDFYGRVSDDGVTWTTPLNGGSPVNRPDLTGLPVQVGLWQCTYINTTGYMAFDAFELTYMDPGAASNPSPSPGEDDVSVNAQLSWTSGQFVQAVDGHRVFIGTDQQDVTDAALADHPNVDVYIVSEPLCVPDLLDTEQTYYWRVDEVNGESVWKGDIWYFTTETGKAKNPDPADNSAGRLHPILSWTASGAAQSHDVYFGTDETAVTQAWRPAGDVGGDGLVDMLDIELIALQWLLDPPVDLLPSADLHVDERVDYHDFSILAMDWKKQADPEFKGNQLSTTCDPGVLEAGMNYFWRVDEVSEGRRWKGDTWSFSTGYYEWPPYNPTVAYDYVDEYGTIDPPTQILNDVTNDNGDPVGTYADGWWCFRWGSDKNPAVTEDAWIPMVQRFNEDFDYITNVMRWPRDKRAREGYYSTIYLFGSGLSTDDASNTEGGGWQGTTWYNGQAWPMVLASYIPVVAFNPASYNGYQAGAMIHEGIHCILSSMPGCKNAGWFHEGGNTWLQGTMEAQRSGNYSGMGWLSAGAAIAPFMPVECYSGWLQDGSFGGPSAQGVNQYVDGQQICTWRNLLGGTQYGECFPHALEVMLGPKSIAWVWRYSTQSGRVLQDLAEAPDGLGAAQTRRLIQEYRARQAFCDFGPWSYAFRQLLNNNWGAAIQEEYSPYWYDVDPWYATCYAATTQNGSELTPEYRTLPGWSGANQIPLTVDAGADEAIVEFNPIGANMSCQLVYRDTGGKVRYGSPVSSGICSIPLSNVRNNVIVAVICNTDYIYSGESTRTAKYNYTLTLGPGVTGKASINTRWYDYNPSSYTIKASSGDNGTISPSGNVAVSAGSNRTFTLSPAPGYEVDDVILNGLGVGALNTYTFTNVRGDHTIAVTFKPSGN